MNDIVKSQPETPDKAIDTRPIFRGYTIEELRYQRALVALKKDFSQTKFLRSVDGLKKVNPLSPASTAASLQGKVGSVATKLLSGLNYLDYAMLGFSMFKSARKIYSFFHRKK